MIFVPLWVISLSIIILRSFCVVKMLIQPPDFLLLFLGFFFFFVCAEIQETPEFLLLKSFLERSFGWEGGSQGRGYMYTYNWFMMLYSRKQHNIVKQLFSNLKKIRLRNSRNRKNRRSLSAYKKCINRNLSFILVLFSLCIFKMFDPYSIWNFLVR